jgi:hypothetical protein
MIIEPTNEALQKWLDETGAREHDSVFIFYKNWKGLRSSRYKEHPKLQVNEEEKRLELVFPSGFIVNPHFYELDLVYHKNTRRLEICISKLKPTPVERCYHVASAALNDWKAKNS